MSDWTLFSNHGHVLICLARDPEARLRDVAAAVGITERAVQKIVRDLQRGGMITVSKHGRRNQYQVHRKAGLRHALESDSNIGGLIDFINIKGGIAVTARLQSKEKAIVQKDVVQKPDVLRPVVPKPIVQKPVVQKPVVQKPVVQKPVVQEPVVQTLVVEKPIVKEFGGKPESKSSDASQSDTEPVATESPEKKKISEKAKVKNEIEKKQGSLF